MPYNSVGQLPENIRKLSATKQRQWMNVWNSAYSRCSKGGKDAKACESSAFAQANGVVLGGKSNNSATFAAGVATFELQAARAPVYDDGEMVYRPGMVFRAGEYPDKDYSMTPEEISAAVDAFADPIALDLEHVPTPLDGKLGELVSVEASDDGSELHGMVALPKWLDSALDERKVSATWDRETKTLAGLALVRNPRVTDAALMAAFAVDEITHAEAGEQERALVAMAEYFAAARHDTHEGQESIQMLHNTAARAGAVCKASNAKMASSHEASVIQKVHDLTTEHGATCSSKKAGMPYPFYSKGGNAVTTMWDKFVEMMKGTPAASESGSEGGAATGTATVAMNVAESAEFKALKERTDAVEAENRRIRAERIHDQAAAFADEQIRGRRAFPAEKEAIISQYVQAATDDGLHGVVTFGEGDQKKTTSRVEMLQASFEARKTHGLTEEQLKDPTLSALMNRSETETEDKPADDKRVAELANMTPLGRATFAKKNGTN